MIHITDGLTLPLQSNLPTADSSKDLLQRAIERMKSQSASVQVLPDPVEITLPPGSVTQEQFERLLAFLGLPEQARDFLLAVLERPDDSDLFSVLADYLEEQGRQKAAEKMRERAEKES